MSFATILGVLSAFGLFIGAVLSKTDNYFIFVNGAGFIMVVGGTLAATFVSYEPRYVFLALKLIFRIVFSPKVGRMILKSEVGRVIRWTYLVQQKGIHGLEEDAKTHKTDKFTAFGIEMVVTGYKGHEIKEILHNTIETTFGRNTVQVDILRTMAATSPAFGMIGTLVGLVIMLDKMGSDPASLGAGLAVALLTTLYGILMARLIYLPAASKIQQREEIIRFRNYLLAEGLILLADGENPMYIQDKMNSYLDPAIHFDLNRANKKIRRPEIAAE